MYIRVYVCTCTCTCTLHVHIIAHTYVCRWMWKNEMCRFKAPWPQVAYFFWPLAWTREAMPFVSFRHDFN